MPYPLMARVVLSLPSLTQGMLYPFDLNMTMCSNIAIFEVMSYVYLVSGMTISGDDNWQIVKRVCFVFVKRLVFLVGVPPGSAGESNRTVLRASTGMVVFGGGVVPCGSTVGYFGTTVGTILGIRYEGKYEITD